MQTHRCSKCDAVKPWSDFYLRTQGPCKGKPQSYCKECQLRICEENRRRRRRDDPTGERQKDRRQRYRRKYGLSMAAADLLHASPCAICGGESGVIDHDHRTGKVRGALCRHCNLGLGHFKDDLHALEQAVRYLRSML